MNTQARTCTHALAHTKNARQIQKSTFIRYVAASGAFYRASSPHARARGQQWVSSWRYLHHIHWLPHAATTIRHHIGGWNILTVKENSPLKKLTSCTKENSVAMVFSKNAYGDVLIEQHDWFDPAQSMLLPVSREEVSAYLKTKVTLIRTHTITQSICYKACVKKTISLLPSRAHTRSQK